MTDFPRLLAALPGNILEYGGSNSGKLYANYPWPPLDKLPAHRDNTMERLTFLLEALGGDVSGKSILDIGCSNGALSIGMALQGAYVVGCDWNGAELEIAELAAKVMGVRKTVTFQQLDVANPLSRQTWAWMPLMAKRDICLFLSVWKWIVRSRGIEAANTMLREISRKGGILLFESGVTDSGIDLVPYKKADMEQILRDNTSYTKIEMVGSVPQDWQKVDRQLWRCS